jgi:hypothetical protein
MNATVTSNPQTLSNTATITPPSGIVDPNPGNNTSTYSHTLVCGSEAVIVPDGRLTLATIGAGATVRVAASLNIGNSYSVEFKNTAGTSTPPGTLTIYAGDDGCSGTSSVSSTDASGIDPAGTGGVVRRSFTARGTQTLFSATLVNGSGSAIPFSVTWSDTTLYSPAWSTNGLFDTFYSLQNTTGSDLFGMLILVDTSGAVQKNVPIVIPAGTTASANTASLSISRNLTGTAKFTHNGPPGSVVAEAAIANFGLNPAYVQPVKFRPVREERPGH